MDSIILGFEGTDPHSSSVKRVQDYLRQELLRGVILFTHNIQDASQLEELTASLKEARDDAIISIDQEGGLVQRLGSKNGFKDYPSAREMSTLSPKKVRSLYGEMAQELSDVGITLNFGPVADLDLGCSIISEKDRSYGSDPKTVINYATLFMEAHAAHGIQTALKHFPGHGSALGDTHLGWVDITESHQEQEKDIFFDLAKHPSQPYIMVAHVMHKKWDAKHPLSLSDQLPRLLGGITNKVVSDDYHMGAIIDRYSLIEIIEHARGAAIDFMIFSNNPAASGGKLTPDPELPEKIAELLNR